MNVKDSGPPSVRVLASPEALAAAAAELVAAAVLEAVAARGRALLALSGGSTPRALHQRLASPPLDRELPWREVEFVFGDERCVPPDDRESNYRMARETLLEPLAVEARRVHRMRGELAPAEAAEGYEEELRALLGRDPLDLALMGIGADGHTASLFPGSAALQERVRWVLATRAPAPPEERVSLTFPVFERAQRLLFLVEGASKAAAVRAAFEPRGNEPVPAARLARGGESCVWLLDAAAAAGLERER